MKKLALFLATMMLLCSFSAVSVTAGNLFVSAGTTNLPTEGSADSMLIGWTYKDGTSTVVLAPGAAFTTENDVELTPLYMDMEMMSGASVRTAKPVGVRFTTSISEPHYQALLATKAEFELGTVIVPSDFIEDEFTIEAMQAANKDYLKIPCKIFWDHNESVRLYTGVISDLYEENYNRNFSARAYLTVTYTDGSAATYYSDYDNKAHSRSAYSISCAALTDPYNGLSDEATAVLQGYIDYVGVDITYTKPAIGDAPATPVNSVKDAHYSISHSWMCQYDPNVPTVFKNDRNYQITITVTPAEGIEFSENTVVKLHGTVVKKGVATIKDGKLVIIQRHLFGQHSWGYEPGELN